MIKKLPNGFAYVEVSNAVSSAKIALQGAHIFEYTVHAKEDLLWLSPTSDFKDAKAIRGGIPICWPRFGVNDKSMPAHGFSRTAEFTLLSINELDGDTTEVILFLEDDEKTHSIWDFSFRLEVIFTISETLSVEMKTKNMDSKEFMITGALHSYFSVSNILNIKIEGLDRHSYLDTLVDKTVVQEGDITINSECDRVYQEVKNDIVLKDENSSVTLNAKGSRSVVIWNPWIEKGSKMSGMKADAYKEFVCIETANAFDDFILIQPSESHSLKVTMSTSLF